ncbi:MAG TPA: glycosyltransferase family 2 protein [Pedobacter sp.]|nr:glycosyltransferase family 2 protein [Pedobacter sp.]
MLFYYLLAAAIVWLGITIFLLANTRRILFLRNQPLAKVFPEIAIVIAVRNEEDDLADALESVCNLDYPNYRVIAINDRSTDQTPVILERYAGQYPFLHIHHIKELPQGWLGKNHALQQGYLQSDSEWLLFTDADIVYQKDALSRAIGYVTRHHLDHLTIFPEIRSRSLLLRGILQTFAIMLEIRLRPWEAPNPASDAYMGIGAFNLVRRSAYQRAGTHLRIPLRPDDDLQLGRLLKSTGSRQDVLYGEDKISLEWYTSVNGFIRGLMKNMFSVSEYQLSKALVAAIGTFFVFCFPVPAALFSGSIYCMLAGGSIVVLQWLLLLFKPARRHWWDFLLMPYAGGIMTYIILKATYKTLSENGISWRDSFYSLDELKKGE